MSYQGYQKLLVEKQDKIVVVKFNNPAKKNCLNLPSYVEITRVLREVNEDESVTIVVFTGVGDYFTAGNDLSQTGDDVQAYLQNSNSIFKDMVLSFIDCKKLIFCLVNGPAIGIGATIAGLSDVAWCTEQAYFLTPFSKLALVPEGCSSYLLPLIVGRSKATELLLLNEPLSAREAYQFGFVSRVFKLDELDTVAWPKIRIYAALPPNSLRESKRLMRLHERESLLRANEAEAKELLNCTQSSEFFEALMNFAMRKNKSKL
ncbi:enoyl-CoA delta isomerase 3, peroxisomal [Scaptodrosophila lebanonensis]|uniref:Enoyl-CoA delta isomerase 3, peroxisomal n=1 Tax=Drosophila lebanonensis TaxID=7225 RepID=A0A6J2TCP1_DROLE|nr:enoyl-CoA delta isomerase 3, peroxisomal [Scaptodrosophila lebanonensis]